MEMLGHWQRHEQVASFPREPILNLSMVGLLSHKPVFILNGNGNCDKQMPSHSITSVTHIKEPKGCGMSDMFTKSKLVNVK